MDILQYVPYHVPAQTTVCRCTGWLLEVNGDMTFSTEENVTNCTYACTNATDVAIVTWKWTGSGVVAADTYRTNF